MTCVCRYLIFRRFLHARAHGDDQLMAPFVNHTRADWGIEDWRQIQGLKVHCKKKQKWYQRSAYFDTGSPAFQKLPYWKIKRLDPDPSTSMKLQRVSSPDELLAVKTEGGLTEERGHELVPVDLVDPAPHGSLPRSCKLLWSLHRYYSIIWKNVKAKICFFMPNNNEICIFNQKF